jgi:hypothetical protein
VPHDTRRARACGYDQHCRPLDRYQHRAGGDWTHSALAQLSTDWFDAVYAIGGSRGVYAVGHSGVAVNAYSYTDIGVNSYGALTGVKGATISSTGAGVVGKNLTAGPGVMGTSAQGVGVTGIASGGNRPVAILGENASGNSDGVAVVAQGGAGVGLDAFGDRAAIRLNPAKRKKGPPTTGLHSMGEMMVDSFGNLSSARQTVRRGPG